MKSWLADNWFKILAIALLLGSFGNNSYSYYEILRWVVCATAAYSAYLYFEGKRTMLLWLFVAMAVLFNPIAPIYMTRNNWQAFDMIAVAVFLAALFVRNGHKTDT